MPIEEQRRSPRQWIGVMAEIHLGAQTIEAQITDVSRHGIGFVLPESVRVEVGQLVWIIIHAGGAHAITGNIKRHEANTIGVEFEEVLSGADLHRLEVSVLTTNDLSAFMGRAAS